MKEKRITIIGCGLIGGSIALALRRWRGDYHVTCLDLPDRLTAVREAQVADEIGTLDDAADHVSQSSIVILATPVGTIPDTLARIGPFLRPGTIVSDVGSTKKRIMMEAQALIPAGVHFVGGHPMAGAEVSGVESADALLFSDRVYLLCPYPDTPPQALLALMDLIEKLLALPVTIDADEHDRMMAVVSHLPQLIAVALMHAAQTEDAGHAILDKVAGRAFLEMTRLALSDYGIWSGILESNREAILHSLDCFGLSLGLLRNAILEGTTPPAWEQAGKARRKLGSESPARPRKADLRSVIDRCDKQMLGALGHRMRAASRIGKLKMNQAAPVHDPDRERRMMFQRREWTKSLGLQPEFVEDLFSLILKYSNQIQNTK